MKNNRKMPGPQDAGRGIQQGSPTSDRAFTDIKVRKKVQGVPNGGGQQHFQTDNKQGTVSKGNQSPDVQGR